MLLESSIWILMTKSVLNFTTSNIRSVWSSNLILMTVVTLNNNCFKYHCYQSPQLKFNDRGFFNIMLLKFSIWILMTKVAFNCVTSNIHAVWVSNIIWWPRPFSTLTTPNISLAQVIDWSLMISDFLNIYTTRNIHAARVLNSNFDNKFYSQLYNFEYPCYLSLQSNFDDRG